MHCLGVVDFCFASFAFASFFRGISAHSYVEALYNIDANGLYIGDASHVGGYVRGFYPRNSSYSDPTMIYQLPPTQPPSTPMCKSTQQLNSQAPGFPKLQSSPGGKIAMLYQENGHVTLPQTQVGKPINRGTVYIYGTAKPTSNSLFSDIHKVWTADGKGGDGTGKLLAMQNFDDGQCYQVNSGPISAARQKQFPHVVDALMGPNVWCQNNVVLPKDAQAGQQYTMYWVWDWPTLPGAGRTGLNETYTTCMDVDIASGGSVSQKSAKTYAKVGSKDPAGAAVPADLPHLAVGENVFVSVNTIANTDPSASMINALSIPPPTPTAQSPASASPTPKATKAPIVTSKSEPPVALSSTTATIPTTAAVQPKLTLTPSPEATPAAISSVANGGNKQPQVEVYAMTTIMTTHTILPTDVSAANPTELVKTVTVTVAAPTFAASTQVPSVPVAASTPSIANPPSSTLPLSNSNSTSKKISPGAFDRPETSAKGTATTSVASPSSSGTSGLLIGEPDSSSNTTVVKSEISRHFVIHKRGPVPVRPNEDSKNTKKLTTSAKFRFV